MIFYVFSIPFLNAYVGCFVFWFSIDFGNLDPQNAASYESKTDNCLKLPFHKKIEKVMISGSILVSFCHHFHNFREFVRFLFFH